MTNEVLFLLCRQAQLLSSERGSVTRNGFGSGLHLRTCRWCNAMTIWQPLCPVMHSLGILRAALYSSVIWLEFVNLLALTRGIQYFIYHNCSISLFTVFSFSFPVWEVFAQPGNPSFTLLDSIKLIWQKLAARAQLCYVWIRPRIKPEVRINCVAGSAFLYKSSPERSMGLHYICQFLANIAVVWDQIKV